MEDAERGDVSHVRKEGGKNGLSHAKPVEDEDVSLDDSGEEDEEEPSVVTIHSGVADLRGRALKYSRLKGRVPEILAGDSASTIEVSPRVVVSL